jgi:acyl-CoA synthetase (NDP forming)
MRDIDYLARPRSVAVVGASKDVTKLGGRILSQLLKYGFNKDKIYPINPREVEIFGLKSYPSIKDVPDDLDLAIIAIPSHAVLTVVKECVEKHVKAAIVIAGGFGETGDEGKELQSQLVKIAKEGGMRICGPNTAGVVSLVNNVYASFSTADVIADPVVGEIGYVAQSGAMSAVLLPYAWHQGIGISTYFCTGNQADLEVSDYIEYLVQDPNTKVIAVLMEGVADGAKFRRCAEMAINARKPLVVLKTGRTEKGKVAVRSHTGALAGSDEIYDALFKQLGIIRVRDPEDLFGVAAALAWQPLPKGDRVGIISISGGACSVIADECILAGLKVPEYSEGTLSELRKILPPFAVFRNPLDVTAQMLYTPENLKLCIELAAKDENVDAILLYPAHSIEPGKPFSKYIVEACSTTRGLRKPLLVVWTLGPAIEFVRDLHRNKVPVYLSPRKAVEALKAMVTYSNFLRKRRVSLDPLNR